MPPRLDSDLLRTFVAIADTGSFTRAAAVVGRTQSAVSMQMRRLEGAVGRPLFRRARTGVTPTPAGERYLAEARRILGLMDRFVAPTDDTGVAGTVRVGIPEEYGSTILPDALGEFARSHPQVEVKVRSEVSDGFRKDLDRGRLDLAVIACRPGDERGEILLHDPTVWVGAESLLAHDTEPVPLALFESGCWWRDWALSAMREAGRPYRIACSSASVAGIRAAVSSGLAIAVLGRSTVPDGVRPLPRSAGLPTLPGSNITLQRRAGPASAAADRMAEAIAQAFRAAMG